MLMWPNNVADILETCLERLRRGESPETCLRDYPDVAQDLAPLLDAALDVRALPPPTLAPATRDAIQSQLRRAVVQQRARQRSARPRWLFQAALRFAVVAALILVVGLGGGVAAAQHSLPGSPLYALKRAGERARLQLAATPEQRAALLLDFAGARLDEILMLDSEQRPLDSAVMDDFAQEYQLAWAEIERSPGAAGAALRQRYVVSSHADIAALSAALVHAAGANRSSLMTAVRFGEQALDRAASTAVPKSPPRPAATSHPAAATPKPSANRNPNPTHSPGNGASGTNGTGQGNGAGGTNGTGQGGGNRQDSTPAPPPEPHATPGAPKDGKQPPAPGHSHGNGDRKK